MRMLILSGLFLTMTACGDKETGGGEDSAASSTDADGDGFTADEDCDDNNADINPGADEICDEVDNNCDGDVDGGSGLTIYLDGDGDGYGKAGTDATSCELPDGYASQGGDCDDQDDQIYPGADEYCNGLDDNCDSQADENAVDAYTHYNDSDGDGYGTDSTALVSCAVPEGRATAGGDCNDSEARIYPTAPELCNGQDDDCDSTTSEAGSVSFREGTRYTSLTSIFDSGTSSFPAIYYMDKPGELIFCGGSWKGALIINADVDITGVGGAAANILDAAEESPSILMESGARRVNIEGVTFRRGVANQSGFNSYERSGGGLFCDTTAVMNLTDVVISEANASAGGGAYISGCDVTFTDSQITSSEAVFGGGVTIDAGTLKMYDSSIDNNVGVLYGGGIYSYSRDGKVDITLEDTIVSDNTAGYFGSGIYQYTYYSGNYNNNVTCKATSSGSGGFFRNVDSYAYSSYGVVYLYLYYGSSSSFVSNGCSFGETGSADDNSPNDVYMASPYATYKYGNDVSFTCTKASGCR